MQSTRIARALALAALALAPPVLAAVALSGEWIVVSGSGNTLDDLAAQVGDEKIVRSEPALGITRLGRSLKVAGELVMSGGAEAEGLFRYDRLVEMDISQCGQARIEVLGAQENGGRAATLVLSRTKLSAFHPEKDLDECKESNVLSVRGVLRMKDSLVIGNINCQASDGAHVEIERSTISFCRNYALSLARVRASDILLRESSFLDSAMYGLKIGPVEGTLRIWRCTVRGLAADVYVCDKADVELIDCDVKTIRFAGRAGRVWRKWTVTVHAGAPGLRVVARSEPEAGLRETVRARTGSDGSCRVVLAEYLATPGRSEPEPGENMLTPHTITVLSADGRRALWRISNYRVFMPDQEVVLK